MKVHPSWTGEEQVDTARDEIVRELSHEANLYLFDVEQKTHGRYPFPDPGSYSIVEYEPDLAAVNDYINYKMSCLMKEWDNERAVWGDPKTIEDLSKLALIGAAVVQKKLVSRLRSPLTKPTPSSEPST